MVVLGGGGQFSNGRVIPVSDRHQGPCGGPGEQAVCSEGGSPWVSSNWGTPVAASATWSEDARVARAKSAVQRSLPPKIKNCANWRFWYTAVNVCQCHNVSEVNSSAHLSSVTHVMHSATRGGRVEQKRKPYIYVNIFIYVYTHIHIYIYIYIYIYIHIYRSMYLHIHKFVYIYIHICISVSIYLSFYPSIHKRWYIYICI